MALDILIKNGVVLNGLGSPAFHADVAVKDGRIQKIGFLGEPASKTRIDASGRFVAPGFIDINNASDRHWSLFDHSKLESFLHQGVTTIIGGNCGSSLAPLVRGNTIASIQKWAKVEKINVNWLGMGEFLEQARKQRLALNFATLVGHSTLRRGMIREEFRELTEKETAQTQFLLEKAIEEGALGFSTALNYSHAKAATFDEIVKLSGIATKHKKVYSSHLRDEGGGLISAVKEVIESARAAGASLQISHFKSVGRDNHQFFETALSMIEKAGDEGLNINFDLYPYAVTTSVIYTLLPDWVAVGGRAQLVANLGSPDVRARVIFEMKPNEEEIKNIVIASGAIDKTFIGRTLAQIAQNQGVGVSEALINTLAVAGGRIIGFWPALAEENIIRGLKSSFSLIASDGAAYNLDDARAGYLVHPRSFGTFPRILARYVRDKKIMSWEEAIKKMTALPALKFGLSQRGVIKPGFIADITIFNPETVQDLATYENPFQYANGIDAVIINGNVALLAGKISDKNFGSIIT
ncbi:hypothetical protein A2833_00015 [Candidatus Azambacteria bacterium RIFCSPHIGHO2_01_FULL_44_55]|uniref:Amidohydrolase 3 domain-containing protein n=1 Tax=Candidatus Azambacteria bacterium RIFCSPLOWO2_02_FULL_44_14 TaxID=1797306 RepID=A0A1F5CBR4_9BACT|nr:MAG: hypothetical protein A3A18_00020 [Candidatus Azambacteria bacterium RIFCSPLOWO2_01_FULL_44_84]OGD33170.1 MAG: hypothetical protein A3C78_02830 [Candidatus Azambacteria bacterium RIFCSPHIGHO2_02_FULL_45_18]OGD40242.1 MAG: hypothetical protein A2833_00015 [Candidatus Azambacteria bacterium RIFCSPHIGHO2_01_FULL_44_55]OGD40275.1 MAG: hypothetical protein A3I30_03190 [Candidatus Azambacteria bacterium RIFCSPLOWO2_02_FULL_44_14]